jgi:phospholipid transport system substrate-binding protein
LRLYELESSSSLFARGIGRADFAEKSGYDLVRKGDMNILGFLTFILLLMIPMATPMASAGDHEATQVVEKLHSTLLAVMKDGAKIGYQGRYEQLAPVIKSSFDMPFVSRTVLGKYWESLNDEQRSRFVEAFTELSIATYAANFDRYSGERFKTISEKEVSGGRILVQSELIKSNGGQVHLDYLLHRTAGQCLIVNIIAEGVSDLALKRADYSAFLKSKGFEALLKKLNEKINQYSRK